MGTQGIQVGDAVLKFLADTTDVDRGFASIGPKAKAAMGPANDALEDVQDNLGKTGKGAEDAGDEVEDAGKRSAKALREARGEAGLLGELFGIRLPRHVRSFIAELPGVSTALSAAFSATAILFIIQALIQAEEKLRAFLSHAKEHEAQAAYIERENAAIADQGKIAEQAADELNKLVHTPVEILTQKIASLTAEYDHLYLARAPEAILAAKGKALENEIALLQEQLALEKQKQAEETNSKVLENLTKEIELRRSLANVQVMYNEAVHGLDKDNADEQRYQISLKALQKQAEAESKYGKDAVDKVRQINAQIEALQASHTNAMGEELSKEQSAYEKNLDDLGKSLVEHNEELTIANTVQQASMEQLSRAAQKLGITLKSDLVYAYDQAIQAQKELIASGLATQTELKDAGKAVEEAKKKLDDYGQTVDKFKLKSSGMWKEFDNEAKSARLTMDLVKQAGVTAFDDLSKNIQSAFASIVLGQENVAQALEKATASSLASIASQAAVKAIYYTAEGFAALAGFNPGSAADFFTAAGEMAAVAGAAGVAGRALSNASGGGANGGSGSNPSQLQNNASNTSGSGSRGSVGVTSVQGHATGALIMSPTLATFAENGPEAAIPLNDPRAMGHIGKAVADAIAAQGGGGVQHHTHVNVNGMISPDNLSKVMDQMSKRVLRGQSTLHASNTLRITKRSA